MNRLMNFFMSLVRGVGVLSPSCKEASRLQSEALDHPLSISQRIGLRIHVALCKWCRRYGKQLRFLRIVAGEQENHDHSLPPQSLSPDAKQRISERLKLEKR